MPHTYMTFRCITVPSSINGSTGGCERSSPSEASQLPSSMYLLANVPTLSLTKTLAGNWRHSRAGRWVEAGIKGDEQEAQLAAMVIYLTASEHPARYTHRNISNFNNIEKGRISTYARTELYFTYFCASCVRKTFFQTALYLETTHLYLTRATHHYLGTHPRCARLYPCS